MKDDLNTYFSKTNFDFDEPQLEHFERFEKKLNTIHKTEKISWKWLSVAASILLIVGFWFGKTQQTKTLDLADVSPKLKEVQSYFVTTIQQELKTIEKYKSNENKEIIEQALIQITTLEQEYQHLLKELNTPGNQTKIISFMIKNYQLRLEILESVLEKINEIKNLKQEIYV